MSSTPNHSLVPSVATAAVDERIAGMNPAAAVARVLLTSGVWTAERAVLTPSPVVAGTKAEAEAKRARRANTVFIILKVVLLEIYLRRI